MVVWVGAGGVDEGNDTAARGAHTVSILESVARGNDRKLTHHLAACKRGGLVSVGIHRHREVARYTLKKCERMRESDRSTPADAPNGYPRTSAGVVIVVSTNRNGSADAFRRSVRVETKQGGGCDGRKRFTLGPSERTPLRETGRSTTRVMSCVSARETTGP